MTPRSSAAEAILQRLLVVLPLAAREEGLQVERAAEDLGVEPKRLLRDLEELNSRSYYLPAGPGDQIQLRLTREHLGVWTTGEFRRPPRLSPREALALELALRVVARSATGGERTTLEDLRARVVDRLRSPEPADAAPPRIALAGAEDDDPVRVAVEAAVHERRELRIRYRAPGREPTLRRVQPLRLGHAEGRWYLLGRDTGRQGLRAFRVDRILEADATDCPFTARPDDEQAVEQFFRDGRIHDGGESDAAEPFDARVEYSPRIARWIREHGWDVEEEAEDGTLRVRHRVVDPEWLVRHVLAYGPEAKVLDPPFLRERMRTVAEEMQSRARHGTPESPGKHRI